MQVSIEQLDKYKANVDDINRALMLKADALLVEEYLLEFKDKELHSILNKAIDSKLVTKCNIKDVCKLLDLKANVKWVESLLKTVSAELHSKQDLIKTLEKECLHLRLTNHTCKYLWNGGQLNKHRAVPWEHEVCNGNSNNFEWDITNKSIIIRENGF